MDLFHLTANHPVPSIPENPDKGQHFHYCSAHHGTWLHDAADCRRRGRALTCGACGETMRHLWPPLPATRKPPFALRIYL